MKALKLAVMVQLFAFTWTLVGLAPSAKADLLELTNGDHYRGVVVSMTRSNLQFQSEIQGLVTLPRDKVAQITFREAVVSHPVATATNAAPRIVGAPLILSGPDNPAQHNSAEAVANQMRQQGVDPKLVNQIQEQIFGKANPEAAQKFNETMDGFLSGKISVQDIRGQAIDSIKQIKEARQALGNDAGDMLDGYLSILEKFVQETGPSGSGTTTAQPTSSIAAGVAPGANPGK
jgi:hypothetical protein